jgi:hypothetical protein
VLAQGAISDGRGDHAVGPLARFCCARCITAIEMA